VKPRSFVLSALLTGSLSLASLAHAAPGDAGPLPTPSPTTALAPSPGTIAAPSAPAGSAVQPLTAPKASAPPQVPVAPPAPGKALPKPPAPKTPIEAALLQVVMLERAGRPIGIGTLLSSDGRILTALSPLSHGNLIDARYPEGQIVRVRISHSNRAWDLALLTPEGDARRAGLRAARGATPSAGTKLHAVSYVKDKQLGASDITIKAKSTLRGGDSAELPDALELQYVPKATDIGGPLLNDQGEVVAIIARACSVTDKQGCTLAPYAAPVSALRGFLRGVPMRRGPWLGVEVVAFDAGMARGVRVAALAPDGPASAAGLRAGPPGVGDVVLAVDGAPVTTAEAFANAVDSHAFGPGTTLRLTVLSEGRYRDVPVLLHEPEGGPKRPLDRAIQSNPASPWPRAPRPANAPNPYR